MNWASITHSHVHEAMPLLHAHKPLLRDQKHGHSLFMDLIMVIKKTKEFLLIA